MSHNARMLVVHKTLLVALGIGLAAGLASGCRSSKDDKTRAKKQLETLPYLNWVPVDDKTRTADGVVVNIADATSAGYNLYNSRPRSEAVLMGLDGTVHHRWTGHDADGWHHIEMAPDGSLLVIVKDASISKLDWRSQELWSRQVRAHHDIALAPGGDIHVLTREERTLPGGELRFLDDFIEILDLQGKTRERVSIYDLFGSQVTAEAMDALREANGDAEARLEPGGPFDLFHTNSIELLDRDVPGLGKAGNVLVSMRQLHTIAVVDMARREVVWRWGPGELQHQHHPTVMENGHVLVFDNGTERGYSRVLEIDPKSIGPVGDADGAGKSPIVWQYSEGPKGSFFSKSRGANQPLPNGNVLITESNDGRAFEVTRDQRIVWDFYNPDRKDDRRAAIYRMQRLSREAVDPLLDAAPVPAAGDAGAAAPEQDTANP